MGNREVETSNTGDYKVQDDTYVLRFHNMFISFLSFPKRVDRIGFNYKVASYARKVIGEI